jgi:hypothetical protein
MALIFVDNNEMINNRTLKRPVPEFIEPVFTKTSPKRSFSVMQNERFGLVFAKTGSIISGMGRDIEIQIFRQKLTILMNSSK